ncbi:MAG: tetratricopeptide repeat protein [Saprospiraceae bacterium]
MKFNYVLLLPIFIIFSACKSEKQAAQVDIQQLEAAVNAAPDQAPLDSLLLAYQHYISTYPNDNEQITNYRNNAQNLLEKRLAYLKKITFNESTGVLDQQAVREFIQLAEYYAVILPEAKQTPDWLYQAAELAGSLHEYGKTLTLFQMVNERYPKYEKASQVLFMRAFTLDSELKRFEEARPLYQEFLQKYPNDDFADDAQFLLDNLGKSEEEIIRAFQEKQAQQ